MSKSSGILNEKMPFFESRRFKEACVLFDSSEDGEKCAIIFSYGIAIFWGMMQEEENDILKMIQPAEIRPMDFVDIEKHPISLISGDYNFVKVCDIKLDRFGFKDKLAFSFAASQSLKVHFYEQTVESSAGDMHFLSESLHSTGVVSMSRKQICKKIGEVFLKKNMINLNSEAIDIPDIIWENDSLEAIYESAIVYFDINNRMSVLNKRLDTMSDLLALLGEELRFRSGERTEKIIVLLIFIEVIIAIVEFYFYRIK